MLRIKKGVVMVFKATCPGHRVKTKLQNYIHLQSSLDLSHYITLHLQCKYSRLWLCLNHVTLHHPYISLQTGMFVLWWWPQSCHCGTWHTTHTVCVCVCVFVCVWFMRYNYVLTLRWYNSPCVCVCVGVAWTSVYYDTAQAQTQDTHTHTNI